LVGACVLAGALSPASAWAGSVHMLYLEAAEFAVYNAGSGESNSLVVSYLPETRRLLFYDGSAPLTAGEGCEQMRPHAALCWGQTARVFLNDGNDKLWLVNTDDYTSCSSRGCSTWHTEAYGGDGADKLVGSQYTDLLAGGAGNDVLVGNRGRDTLVGGPENDKIDAYDLAADRIDCGTGNDTLLADPFDTFRLGCEGLLG
jgi:Ca2+-binding RTX toxin-like protein